MHGAGRILGGLIIHEHARSIRFLFINTGRNGGVGLLGKLIVRRGEQTQYYLIMAETFLWVFIRFVL